MWLELYFVDFHEIRISVEGIDFQKNSGKTFYTETFGYLCVSIMKRYTTNTADTCWNDSLACLLEIPPKRVPNFLKLYKDAYMDETRKWLKENFNKGIIYIPARAFMECSKSRYNPPIGPSGFSIVIFDMVDDRKRHAAIAFNGGVLWDNGSSRIGVLLLGIRLCSLLRSRWIAAYGREPSTFAAQRRALPSLIAHCLCL